MLLIFLSLLINSFEGFSKAEVETLCTSNACFTLHMARRNFENASQTCIHNGGYLMTVRDTEEEDVLRSLLSKIPKHHETPKFWIGLKLKRGDCVLADKTLKGFKWVSGEENSHYSNWKKEPVITCTEERCVIAHHSSGENRLKWIDRGCRTTAFYACKFYFMGMCKPLALLGPGQITYTAAFSEKPQRTDMKLFPLGTYAEILCDDKQSHHSVCIGTDNTYKWNDPGPFCKTGKQSCTINNGGCQHLCHEYEDEVQCFCKEGYELDEDKLTCRIKDLCSDDTCEYRCVMTSLDEPGYSCKCPVGFQLDANQRNCSDIDECQSENCDHHLCLNTHGSYTCACKDGYEMVDGKCTDVDECARLRCDHSCLNSIGSFSCHCNEGFALSEDGHSCADIDECVSNRCQFKCINTVGSFLCICPPGFQVEANGSCTVQTTATSTSDEAAASSEEAAEGDTQDNFTEESLTRTTVELQHQSPHTDAPLPVLVNITHNDRQGNASLVTSFTNTVNSRVLICVLGSVIPLLLLVIVTLAIAIFRCSSSKKEAKKKNTTDGYCWVSSGLDPRLEKLYESILTDDL